MFNFYKNRDGNRHLNSCIDSQKTEKKYLQNPKGKLLPCCNSILRQLLIAKGTDIQT